MIGSDTGVLNTANGIGGNVGESTGSITLTSGKIITGWLGNGAGYTGVQKLNIILDRAALGLKGGSISPSIKDTSGNTLSMISVSKPSGRWGSLTSYTRTNTKDTYYSAYVRDDGSIEAYIEKKLLGKKGAAIKIKDNGKVYTVGLSSGASNTFKAEETGETSNSSETQALTGVQAASKLGSVAKGITVVDGIVYQGESRITAKSGYTLGVNLDNLKSTISINKDGRYDGYRLYIQKTSSGETWKLHIGILVVDTAAPKITKKSGGLKLATTAPANVKTKSKKITLKVAGSYGVSGKRYLRYRVDTKDKNGAWKNVPSSGRIVLKTSKTYKRIIVRACDRAGNIKTYQTGWVRRK